MTKADHLTADLLVRAVDDELSGPESIGVESHLAECMECKQRYQAIRALSADIESAVNATVQEDAALPAHRLAELLQPAAVRRSRVVAPVMVRGFGWGMAIAAMLALGVMFLRHPSAPIGNHLLAADSQAAFEVNGETFLPLPYSNPDLPLTAPRIVQMQVPVSSLAEAGIVLEPVSNVIAGGEDSVLADVLIGIDGQPLGIHVLPAQ